MHELIPVLKTSYLLRTKKIWNISGSPGATWGNSVRSPDSDHINVTSIQWEFIKSKTLQKNTSGLWKQIFKKSVRWNISKQFCLSSFPRYLAITCLMHVGVSNISSKNGETTIVLFSVCMEIWATELSLDEWWQCNLYLSRMNEFQCYIPSTHSVPGLVLVSHQDRQFSGKWKRNSDEWLVNYWLSSVVGAAFVAVDK